MHSVSEKQDRRRRHDSAAHLPPVHCECLLLWRGHQPLSDSEALCKQAINKRNRSRIRQLDTSVERRALGEIQNVGEGATTAQGSWQSAESSQSHLGEQSQSAPGGRSQRRERHNRMERDRRRRIRICCDELNLLVPFCNAETDKATTLQWTTAFLKYIQERHGDSLKKIPNCPLCPGIRRYGVIVSKSSARGVCSSLSEVASAWPAHSMIVEMTGVALETG
ncbi:transcription factor-like 5 protein isoform X7 [Myotis lucifugus]|uniref:transcription factor-like 5 protein isoform X7 n=1 Tax=Myotis lucifugus TaxID=59463 RepID=UPI000CCC691F|nr:transcription factor-like 5 protein isoform X7 [Myotis lucifugus]